ncbi:polysaccharide pyruvyl transferase family protein [Sporanaerobacter acetigenes]|uniref:polysaccharide pyruvyl transferase family protein n=1 Tax=Sporanaerobacter acetigenes TaxID=165813 RepID=UPI00331D8303
MKKVGLVTYHNSRSYGATLQAYATLKAIELFGFEAEFVNYTNKYEQNTNKSKAKGLKGIIGTYKNKIKAIIFNDEYYKKTAFGNNVDFYENKVSRFYHSLTELNETDYDILLVGSDQVWNPKITNGIDSFYFLNFGNPTRRISYASSMGSYVPTDDEKKVYKEWLEKFYKLSVREVHARKIIEEILDKDIDIVVDPTLLFSSTEWDKYLDESVLDNCYRDIDKKYILTFFVGGKASKYIEDINYIKNVTNLPVYNIHINKHKHKGVDCVLPGVNVKEFVYLIKHAELVITDSFHGTVFSILYKKNFSAISNKANPIRVIELLKTLNLLERLDNPNCCSKNINYNSVFYQLGTLRNQSIEWLKGALLDDNK